ncbi:hypothetical protein ACQ4PT_066540 [Festuca glaucescens]
MDIAARVPQRRRWKRKKRTAATVGATLPEDVVLEILGRAADAEDVVTLFRCATACKRWRGLLSDPSFLRGRHRPEPSSSFLLGFFAQQRPYRAHTVSADPIAGGRALVHLAVCSLLAGTCDLLPPLKCRASSTINKCAILTHTDSCSNGQSPSLPLPSFSQVLVIVFNGASRNYNLCTFSSAEWNWSPPPRNCFSDPELRVADGSAVICQGMACWLVSDTENFCTLDVGAENGQFFLRDLPAPPDHGIPLLSVAIDGTLSMLLLDVYCCWLEIWWLQGGEESGGDDDVVDLDWLCATVIELKPPKFVHMTCLCVGERSSTLLVMDTLIRSVCFVDIETGAVDEVTEQFRRLNLETAVPFEMDWPVFFLSRLEGPRAKVREPMRLPEFFGVHFELVNPDLVMLDDKR